MKDYISYLSLMNVQPGLIFYNKRSDRACIVTGNDGFGLEVEEIELDPDCGLILKSIKQKLENTYRLPSYEKTDFKDIGKDI